MSRKPKLLITGASGLLGHALCEYFASTYEVLGLRLSKSIDVNGVSEAIVDLTQREKMRETLLSFRPEVVIHTAGLTNVDQCESDRSLAQLMNVTVTGFVSEACSEVGAKLVHISTDHLFNGEHAFATEDEKIEPLNVYAETKAQAEGQALLAPRALILRTNFYGPGRPWRVSFSDWILGHFQKQLPITLFTDSYFTPIAIQNLAEVIAKLIVKDATGVVNVAGKDRVSKYEFGMQLAKRFGFDTSLIRQSSIADMHLKARRPKDMSLSTAKLAQILGAPAPGLKEGLETLATPSGAKS